MAVDLTVNQLAVALRVAVDESAPLDSGLESVLTRLLASATALVTSYAPAAPDSILNESVVRCASWLFDAPTGRAYGSPLDHSGARALLAPFRERRAVSLETAGESDGC